jgi:hypothetical protein
MRGFVEVSGAALADSVAFAAPNATVGSKNPALAWQDGASLTITRRKKRPRLPCDNRGDEVVWEQAGSGIHLLPSRVLRHYSFKLAKP